MSHSLQDEFIKKELLHGAQNYSPLSVVLEKGKGVYLWDVDGNKYLDLVSFNKTFLAWLPYCYCLLFLFWNG